MSEKKYKTFADLKLVPQKDSASLNQSQVPLATPVTSVTPVTNVTPVTPVNNFQKIPNSIVKDAIPAGMFKSGKTKELYDVLYDLTRGAINPTRTIQISKPRLQKLSNISSPKTLANNLLNLQLVGLVRITVNETGKHDGNIYEIVIPNEVTTITPVTPVTPDTPVQKVPPVPPVESSPRYTGLNQTNERVSDSAKTSFKTIDKTIDDERTKPFRKFAETLNRGFAEVAGKESRESDADDLNVIAEILIDELRAARLKTKSISSPAAFLARHLRARLSGAQQIKQAKLKLDTVGKPVNDNSEAEKAKVDLSHYTPEELIEFEKQFCLSCGKLHEECGCIKPATNSEN